MSIEARAKLLIDQLRVPQRELEAKSGISQQVWSKALNGKQRLNSDHLGFLCTEYSDYAFWLMTGREGTSQNQTPPDAKYIQAFEPISKRYAQSLAEIEYVIDIEKYFTNPDDHEDEFGISGPSPMPSIRKANLTKIEHDLLNQDLSEYIKKNRQTSDEYLKDAAQNYFREKATNFLFQIQNEYGRSHKMLVVAGRMLGEFLLPGSKSNVMNFQDLIDQE